VVTSNTVKCRRRRVLSRYFRSAAEESPYGNGTCVCDGSETLLREYGVLIALVGGISRSGNRIGLDAADGTWFLWVVATQSVAVSTAAYAKIAHSDVAATLAVLCWGLGVLQLILVATIVGARLIFVGVGPTDETAPYWVFMGSGAISILAAAEVLGTAEEQIVFPRDVVGGVAMAIWAFGTWLIPLIIGLMLWQRTRPNSPRGYRSALWAMVFPIGMYGESSRQLGFIRGTEWLDDLGTWEAWIAFAVWAVVFVGMLYAGLRRVSRPTTPA